MLYGFFILITFIVIVIVFTRITTGDANFFGLKIYSIQTSSMEPNYPAGSLTLETTKYQIKDIKKGDVITFDMKLKDYKIPNTHRVVGFYYYDSVEDDYQSEIDNSSIISFEDFYKFYDKERYEIVGFRTKGDNPLASMDTNPVMFDSVMAKLIVGLPLIAKLYNFIMKPLGFVTIIIIPMLTIIIVQIISSIRIYKKKDDNEDKLDNNLVQVDLEELKRQAVEEYIRNHQEEKKE